MRIALAALGAAVLLLTLSLPARAEKGVVSKVSQSSSGVTEITYKDYRPKKAKAAKVDFQEYDLVAPASYAAPVATEMATPYEDSSASYQQVPAATQGYAPGQTYTQTYAPGPNASMTASGGGSLWSTTYSYWAGPPYGLYGPYYGNAYYPYNPYAPTPYRPAVSPYVYSPCTSTGGAVVIIRFR